MGTATATVDGNVTTLGGTNATISDRGAYISTTSGQVATTGGTAVSAGSAGTGTYTTSLSGLTSNTLYYTAAYATSTDGTGRGNQASFTTRAIVATDAVTAVSYNTATANGTITAGGAAAITDRGVYLSTTTGAVANGTKQAAATLSGTGAYTVSLASLTPSTTYYVVAYVANAGGTTYGTEQTFTTPTPAAPTVTTAAATTPTSTGVTLGGAATANGAAITEYGVVYSTSNTTPTTADTKMIMTGGPSSFSQVVSPLAAGTYYVRAYAATGTTATGYGSAITVVINPLPTITSLSPASVTAGSAAQTLTINGTNFLSTSTATYGGVARTATFVNATQLTIPLSTTDLATGGTYPVVVTNPTPGGGASNTSNFMVVAQAPTVTTGAATAISYNSATANGNVTSANGNAVTARGFYLSTTMGQVATGGGTQQAAALGSGTGAYTLTLSGLSAGTTYYVAAYATNATGTSYGAEVAFTTTAATVPTVTTATPSSLSNTGATLGGSVTSNNGAAPTEYGVVYSTTNTTPTVADAKAIMTNGPTNFNQAVALAAGTYSVRAYAINTAGPGYGPTVTLTVNPAPTITSLNPASVSYGSGATTLFVNGTGFVSGTTTATYGGTNKTVTFISATQLSIPITTTDANLVGTKAVVVTNAAAGGGSASADFTVTPVAPTVTTNAVTTFSYTTATVPASALVGSGNAAITERGIYYGTTPGVVATGGGTKVQFGTAASGSFSTSLTGLTPGTTYYAAAYAINAAGTGFGAEQSFTTTPPNPVPTISSLSPNPVNAGAAATTLTITGTGYVSGVTTATYNNSARTVTFVSATQLTIPLTTTDVATAGSFPVVVTNTTPGGGTSNSISLTVVNAAPTLTSISPATALTGTTTTVTFTGTGFSAASVVNFNNTTLTPATVTATTITVSIAAPATAGPYLVSVANPAPGGGTSGTQTFTVTSGPLATYSTTGLSSGSTSVPTAFVAANFSATGIGRGAGAGAPNSIAGNTFALTVPNGNTVPTTLAGAIANNIYFGFNVGANSGYSATILDLPVNAYRTGNGLGTIELLYSLDGTNFPAANSLGTLSLATSAPSTPNTFTVPASALQNVVGTVYFRLYAYNGSGNGGATGYGNVYLVNNATSNRAVVVNGTVTMGTPVPEINLAQGNTNILSGTGSFGFGPVKVGNSTATTTFSIQNTGTAVLNLAVAPADVVTISGNTADFTLTQPTGRTVAATNGTLPFTIAFTPTSTGTKAATISIANNDSDENPYTFTVTGTGVVAPIITSFTPASGPVGTAVTITGTDFTNGTTVTFTNNVAATAVTFNSTTSLTATAPSGTTTGPITVANTYGSSTSATSFTVTATPTAGDLLLEDNFAYAAGQPLTSNGWTGYSGLSTGPPVTVAGNLTSTQYPRGFSQAELPSFAGSSSAKLDAALEQDVSRSFGTTASTLYVATVINVASTSTNSTDGDFYVSFADATNNTSNLRGRVYLKQVGTAAAGTFQFGVGASSASGLFTTGTPYTTGTNYLVVLKYTSGGGTQTASLFVYSGAAPLTEPATPLLTTSGVLASNLADLTNVILRQADNGLMLDGLRVSTNWGTAIGRPVYVDETALLRPGNYYDVSVSGATSLTTTGAASVEGTLSLGGGNITTTAANLLTLTNANASAVSGSSATSFVNGPLARATATGAANTVFPIGRGTAYRPLTLTATAQVAASTYTATQVEGDPGQPATSNALVRVSRIRSFVVTSSNPTAGNFTGTITLSYGTDDGVNTPNDPGFKIAKRDQPADWVNIGPAAASGSGSNGANVSGTLTSDSFSNFSEFALASTTASTNGMAAPNPLPVSLTGFTAVRNGSNVALSWATASEANSARFEVERSLDGTSFAKVATLAAAGSSLTPRSYATLDRDAPTAALYYRLRAVDLDGSSRYSVVVVVAGNEAELALSPNPARSEVRLLTAAATPYVLRSTLGQVVLSGTTQAGTPTTVGLQSLAAGVYFFELQAGAGRVVRKLVKE